MDNLEVSQHIADRSIADELKNSYLTYAMSVIVSRALPDARDGLKPSQRRIIYAMHELKLGPRSHFRKCAKIAGDTSGNYHPHGESVVYPTLVRMAQPFNLRYPLVDGQGNFGSIDGDPPAAMRYTEARMTNFAMMMLEDIDKETVDFEYNYDETLKMPTVLPSKFPNLLCNGSDGIAVGMATSIPPHNLTEVCNAILALLDNPDISVDALLKYITGPDFPTGGIICGRDGIVEAYRTGRSRILVRGRVHSEKLKGGKTQLVVTEIPYQLSKTKLIEDMVNSLKLGNIDGISDIRDESDREGIRLVIELKRGEEEEIVLNQLYKFTPLQTTYSMILIALVNNRPELLDLKQMLEIYRDHRVEVIRRRTAFLLDKAEKRAHIVEGLLIALDFIEEVIRIIRSSATVPEAQKALEQRFGLSPIQADAILKMTLARLTGLERNKLEEEYRQLKEEIEGYRAILGDINLVHDIIREDVHEMKTRFGDARRTEIVAAADDIEIEDLIAEEDVAVTISYEGYIKRQPLTSFRKQHRGGKGVIGATTKETDFVYSLFIASTHDYLLMFTNTGRCYWLKVYDIPQVGRVSMGRSIANLLSLRSGERITSVLPVRDFDERFIFMVTRHGTVKKTSLNKFSRPNRAGIYAITLDENDALVSVHITSGDDDILIATRNGMAVKFHESEVREMGRTAHGVAGIRLRGDDTVIGMVPRTQNDNLLTICERGYGKCTDFDEYRRIHRNSMGVINISTNERNGKVVSILSVGINDDLLVITVNGKIIRCPAKGIPCIGRATQGVRIISLDNGDFVSNVTCFTSTGTDEDSENGDEPTEPEVASPQPAPAEIPVENDEPTESEE